MREFSDADRKKKSGRITIPDNPANLSEAALSALENDVSAALIDGYVACPTAWKIAKDADVPRLAVGAMIDKLNKRVTDCQLGCFKVSKTDRLGAVPEPASDDVARRVEALYEQGTLTCANVYTLAGELHEKPRTVADAANAKGYKMKQCQLGCF